jgi:phosphomannomutase
MFVSGMVDSTGLEINKNRLIALLAAVVLDEHPGTTIVTDSVTNTGIKAFIAQKGGKHYRYMRGYANIIAKVNHITNRCTHNTHISHNTHNTPNKP